MTILAKTTFVTALLIPGLAYAAMNAGDFAGTTEAEIRAALEASGYTIMEVETEKDEIEFEVLLDGVEMEIEVSLETGMVTEIETDDADEDDDEDDD